MKAFTFEQGIEVKAEGYYKKDYIFEIKGANLYFKNELYKEEMFENIEDKKEFLEVLKRVIERYNDAKEKIEELKNDVSEMMQNINALPSKWEELKDLRQKAAFELKQETIKKLNELAEELAKNGKWNLVTIGTVDFWDYEKNDGIGDERTLLRWSEENGFYFIKQENKERSGWTDDDSISNAKTFSSLDELGRTNIKRLVKTLPKRIKELTQEYKKDISELKKLKNSIL
jgi:archaellum component FlaC